MPPGLPCRPPRGARSPACHTGPFVEHAARLAMPAVTPAERYNPERYGSSNAIRPAPLRAPPQAAAARWSKPVGLPHRQPCAGGWPLTFLPPAARPPPLVGQALFMKQAHLMGRPCFVVQAVFIGQAGFCGADILVCGRHSCRPLPAALPHPPSRAPAPRLHSGSSGTFPPELSHASLLRYNFPFRRRAASRLARRRQTAASRT